MGVKTLNARQLQWSRRHRLLAEARLMDFGSVAR